MGFFDFLGEKLNDPNIQQAMALAGQAISPEGTAGRDLGGAASQVIRSKALQKEAGEEKDFRKKLLGSILGGNVLSPTQDNQGFDSAKITGDGDVALNFKNTPQTGDMFGKSDSLESASRTGFPKASFGVKGPEAPEIGDFNDILGPL